MDIVVKKGGTKEEIVPGTIGETIKMRDVLEG
jgi:hypothetical protein